MDSQSTLFRREASAARTDRLHGDVSIAVPMQWQLIGYLLLTTLVVAVAFLTAVSYARVETVPGSIVLDKGTSAIVPSRSGVITEILVREGQRVDAGTPLARLRAEEDMRQGATVPKRVRDALREQDRQLNSQSNLVIGAAGAEQDRLRAQIVGLSGEIVSLDRQIESQQRLIDVAASEFRSVETIAAKGFISKRDLEAREATMLSRQQQLAQLQQIQAAKRSDLNAAQRAIGLAAIQGQAQSAAVLSDRAEIAQQMAQADAAEGYVLTAPTAGTVTALAGRVGQVATTQQQLLVIVPPGGEIRAELLVPTSAAGFLSPGQEVRLAIDAFSYQRFGTVQARILQVASVAIPQARPEGGAVPVYIVTARLARPTVRAFGRAQPLMPGMTLTARIVIERQSLIRWLFEPLFAVRNR